MPRETREASTTLVEAANGKWGRSQLGRALEIARNNVGYHYNSGEIGRGFRKAFVDGVMPGLGNAPLISRGTHPANARFYFAHAAAQAYMADRFGEQRFGDFVRQIQDLIDSIYVPLYSVVETFIRTRGSVPFRCYGAGRQG